MERHAQKGTHKQMMLRDAAPKWASPQARLGDNHSPQAKRWGHEKRRGGWNLDDQVAALWPTPSAALTNDQESPETFLARQESLKQKGINGNGAGIPLTVASKMWPTPTSTLGDKGGRVTARKGHEGGTLIEALSLWPTPQGVRDAKSAGTRELLERRTDESSSGQPLVGVACHWPTPRACSGERSSGLNRTEMVNAWGTPSAADAKGRSYMRDGGEKGKERDALVGQAISLSRRKKSLALSRLRRQDPPIIVSGRRSLHNPERLARLSLNPIFVEWLMDWPLGWTDCGSPVMGFTHWLQRQRIALAELSWNYEPVPDAEPEAMQLALI